MIEQDLQESCNETLRALGIPFYHKERGPRTARTHSAGLPDLLWWWKGKAYAVELKTKIGVVSDDQKKWLADLSAQGVYTGVCRSEDEFVGFLMSHGIVKGNKK